MKTKLFSSFLVELNNNDEKLMELVKENHHRAFEKLFNKYKAPILSFVNQMVGNLKVSEEITQSVFLKVYDKRDQFNPEYKFTTWLWTIARNTTYDHLKKKNDYLIDDAFSSEEDGSAVDEIVDHSIGAEERMIEEANSDVVRKCFEALKKRHSEALALRIFSELKYEEIANTIALTLTATKSLINRAKKALIDCVKRCHEEQS